MTPYISKFQFTSWSGRMRWSRRRVSVVEPPVGVDGASVAYDGWSPEVSDIVTRVVVANQDFGDLLINDYLKLLDDPPIAVTVGTPVGKIWYNVLVLGIDPDIDVQTDGRAQVRAAWRLMPTGV